MAELIAKDGDKDDHLDAEKPAQLLRLTRPAEKPVTRDSHSNSSGMLARFHVFIKPYLCSFL